MAPARVILVDTHVALWLFIGDRARFPPETRRLIEESDLAVSPAVAVELAYLNEIGRLGAGPREIIGDLSARIGLTVAQIAFARVCVAALDLTWTRDPFDRLQAAHAIAQNVPLLTKDATILDNLNLAMWPE